MACPCYCHKCQTRLISLKSLISLKLNSLCTRCEERSQIPWSARTEDRCSTCKRIRPVCDFPLDRNSNRTLSCAACHARLRAVYRERKGGPVSQEKRARQFARAQRIVEKALQARIQGEERRKRWLETRER
jgi:hypothetical protein